jgi:uroporphyrinogen-III decarboxylase
MKMAKKRVRMEGAPDWYDKHLDELDFEWSSDEKLEIERYCEKIHQNIAEEEMTPRERFKATLEGKEKDRCLIWSLPLNVYAVRTLDGFGDTLKPRDVYRNPKLLVKAHLATTARFKLDMIFLYTLSYTEDLWGANTRLIDYGNPVMVGDPPVKTLEDLEGMPIPDPYKDGLYPGYLWAVRESSKILKQYDLDDKMELHVSTCPDSVAVAQLGMMGINQFMIATLRDPEVCKKCVDLADEFYLNYCQAVIDLGAHSMWVCFGIGWLPIKGCEWTLDHHEKACKILGPQIPTIITASVPADLQWLPYIMKKNIMGPNAYVGWVSAQDVDYKKLIDTAREYNLVVASLHSDKTLLDGPMSDLEDEIKARIDYGKSHPKFAAAVGAIDYWTPPQHVDAAMAICKKYGKY